jgi:hypothetical protein
MSMGHDRIPDTHRDLLGTDFATLCTVGADAYLDLTNPYRYLEIRGRAEVVPDAPGDHRIKVRIVPVRVNAVNRRG